MNYREFTMEEIIEARVNELKMNEIIESFSGVADYYATIYYKPNRKNDKSDIYNNNLLSIYKSVLTYDPDKGAKFSTYCFNNIKAHSRHYANQTKNSIQGFGLTKGEKIEAENTMVSIYSTTSQNSEVMIVDNLEDKTFNIESDYITTENEQLFWDTIKANLTELQFNAIYGYYKLGYSQVELAELKGVKRQAINNQIMQALKMLRIRLNKDNLTV